MDAIHPANFLQKGRLAVHQRDKKMVTKKNAIDFGPKRCSSHDALTLPTSAIGGTHESGWSISGEIHEDYYEWVNEFEAVHPVYGRVWGDFDSEVFADSEEGFQDFYKNHPPDEWDYWDI